MAEILGRQEVVVPFILVISFCCCCCCCCIAAIICRKKLGARFGFSVRHPQKLSEMPTTSNVQLSAVHGAGSDVGKSSPGSSPGASQAGTPSSLRRALSKQDPAGSPTPHSEGGLKRDPLRRWSPPKPRSKIQKTGSGRLTLSGRMPGPPRRPSTSL